MRLSTDHEAGNLQCGSDEPSAWVTHHRPDMSRLPEVRGEQLGPDAQPVWDAVVGTRGGRLVTQHGSLAGPFNAFVHAPNVGRGLSQLGATLRFGDVDRPTAERGRQDGRGALAGRVEWWACARMARAHGVPDEVVDAIGDGARIG